MFSCGNWFFPGTRDVIPDGHNCCFNHWIGLPTAENMETGVMERHPFYDFQQELCRLIDEDLKRLYAIMKSPKLGITEFWLRFMIWKAIIDPLWDGGQGMVVVGTGREEAAIMIKRCKDIMDNPYHPIPYNRGVNTKNSFTINGFDVYAMPAYNIDHLRSKTNARIIILDEVTFFTKMVDDKRVKEAAEHYYGNRKYYLIMVSTAGERASGFFYKMMKEGDPKYHIIRWTNPEVYGLKPHPESGTHLYNPEKLKELAEDAGTYQRNYLGITGAGAGDIFDTEVLTEISHVPYEIPAKFGRYPSALGVDPAYGRGTGRTGARFGMLGIYKKAGIYYTGFCREIQSPSGKSARAAIHAAMRLGFKTLCIDAADQGLVKDMREHYNVVEMKFNELQKYNVVEQVAGEDQKKYEESLRMIDVVENLTCREKAVRIHPTHDELIDQLRAITRNGRLLPDKSKSRFDVGDAYSMALHHLHRFGDGLGVV